MLALTLIQPWAWAILHAGKRIENRDWRPPQRVVGERIALHAGKKRDDEGLILSQGISPPRALPSMAIVGTARIVGVVTASDDRWFVGDYGWLLDEVQALAEPVLCKGALGLWKLPPDVELAVALEIEKQHQLAARIASGMPRAAPPTAPTPKAEESDRPMAGKDGET